MSGRCPISRIEQSLPDRPDGARAFAGYWIISFPASMRGWVSSEMR